MLFTESQQQMMRMGAIFCAVYFNGVWMRGTKSKMDDIFYVIVISFAVHLAFNYMRPN